MTLEHSTNIEPMPGKVQYDSAARGRAEGQRHSYTIKDSRKLQEASKGNSESFLLALYLDQHPTTDTKNLSNGYMANRLGRNILTRMGKSFGFPNLINYMEKDTKPIRRRQARIGKLEQSISE